MILPKKNTAENRRKHIGRKFFLCLVLMVVMGIGSTYGFTRWMNARTASAQEELSNRSAEFIAAQKQDTQSLWYLQQLTPAPAQASTSQELVKATCFQLYLPFKNKNLKVTEENQQCIVRASVLSPFGVIVISAASDNHRTLRDDSGVNMRISLPKQYTPHVTHFDGFVEQFQFSSKDSLVTFLRKNGMNITIAFSELNGGATAEHFTFTEKIIQSLVLQSLPTPAPTPTPTPNPTPTPLTSDI